MYSSWTITVPAGTTRASPHRATLHLAWGYIDYFAYWIYPESVGLTHFVLEYQARQLYPWDVDENFSTPGQLMEYSPRTEIKGVPYQVEVVAWNEDDTYPHSIFVSIGLQRETLLDLFKKLLGLR